jgi:hypothetical protein
VTAVRAALAACALAAAACASGQDPAAARPAQAVPPEPPAQPAAPASANPLAPFGWFAELAGSCWKGEYPDKVSSDTQCYLAQYDFLIRGSVKGEVTRAGITRTNFEGDAVFAWDAKLGRVVYTQWGSGGTYGRGEIIREGEALVFRNFLTDGAESDVRSVWRRTGPDGFRVERERKGDDGWKEFLAVDYHRVR